MRITTTVRTTTRIPFVQVVKTSVAAIIAWFVCIALLPAQLRIFATIAALLVVQPSINQTFGKAVERSLGVITGVLLALVLGLALGTSSWVVLLAVVVAVLVGWVFRLTPGSSTQIPISAMLVLAIGQLSPVYAVDRIVETIIGAAIGVVVNIAIAPPVLHEASRRAVVGLAGDCAAALDRLAGALSEPVERAELDRMLTRARELRPRHTKAVAEVDRGLESLTLNPLRRRHRALLEADRELLATLTVLVNRVVGMTRAVHDRYDPSLAEEPVVRGIATELTRAAHDVRLLAEHALPGDGHGDGGGPHEEPALTAPLVVLQPSEEHWILIGSLLEDIRRIRSEIIGGAE
ncbi:FUSC family protein [Clavibacter michiganensis]|uniref:Integral membrane bound transporter domain-containing protein n=1 Tax=Clavibacter michiganensis TaxID=28447 RepID=A0A251YL41_9MICO|nr:FUSC family protein [Clavibacter michiganensis]OUE24947.1 hypothetical protein BFL37_09115 [Clavibacter michiganensis]